MIPALGPGFYFQLSVAASLQAVIAIPVNHRNIPGISAEAAGTGAQAGKNAVENNALSDIA
ncbi:VENN motif pre-toxin domain-containing protein [Cedecea colo]|uniref:VENN motif pre-toxin domain-containing protein n=1 Tax=Cedecea colo TaxID=2552946 RepID=UPI0022A7E3C6|nr:VENN motif pre-toxin domain-containing protein [Cedecea colo]